MGSAPQAEMGLKSIAVIFVDVSARPSLRRFSPAHCVESRLIRTMSRRGAKLAVAVVLALHSVLVSAAPDYILAQVTGQQGVSMGRFVSVTSAFTPDDALAKPLSAKLAVANPPDACSPPANAPALAGTITLARRGTCAFLDKVFHLQTAGAVAVFIINDDESAFVMGGTDPDIKIPSSMLSQSDGTKLINDSAVSATLTGYTRSAVDGSLFAMFFVAVGTMIAASIFASSHERSVALAKANHQPVPRRPQEDIAFVTERAAIGFIFVASAGLLLLFFFINQLIWVVIGAFCLGGTQGMVACFSALLTPILPSRYKRTIVVPCCGDVTLLGLALVLPCCGISLWWVLERRADYSWILQNIMSICLLLLMQRTIRLPNIKVSCLLLVLAFLYDIFWVFISGYIFKSSVMISVATGGDTGESIPMLIKMPRFDDTLGGYSLLGLGDIALPGLLVSFLLRFDYRHGLKGFNGYFVIVSIGYAVGVAITDLVLVLSMHGQPALLYLVPCTLGVIVPLAKRRGHLEEMWTGVDGDRDRTASGDSLDVQEPASAGAGGGGSDVEQGEGGRGTGSSTPLMAQAHKEARSDAV